jgi:hypothetical protein
MIETNYSIDGEQLSYEILEDGYMIYKGGTAWIHQYEPHIPNKELSYEENAIAQIEEIVASHEEAKKEQQEKLEAEQKAEQEKAQLLEQIALQDEAINELASLVSELMMAKEVE